MSVVREFPPQGAYADEPALLRVSGRDRTPAAADPIPPLALLWFATLREVSHQPQLVKKLLLAGSLFVVFGESNSGKTFWILDLALAIASGQPWRGRATRKGLVIYVAGEGAASVRARVAAFRQAHPEIGAGLPFAIIPQAVDLLDPAAVQRLLDTIRRAESECGEKCVLVIFDTLARSIPGADENSSQDVGAAVAAADLIRAELGAAVGFVHHSGKDVTKGARGSSALRAASDSEILIEGQSGTRVATATKQRDLEAGEPMPFELESVPLGLDEDGEPISSCVVKHLDAADAPARADKPKSGGTNQAKALTALREWARTRPDVNHIPSSDMAALLAAQGIGRKRRPEVVHFLVNVRILTPTIGGHSVDRGLL